MSQSIQVSLSIRQRSILERFSRSKHSAQQLVERCRVVLLSAAGETNACQAIALGIDRQRVRRWRHRWVAASKILELAESADPSVKNFEKDFERLVLRVLMDEHRSGAPATFTAEQVAALISLACESPADSGLPVSHWTPPELAREAQKRGIVSSISPRQVDRFLAKRNCDRTRVSIGSHRRTNENAPSSTRLTSKESATPIAMRPSLLPKAGTS